ncbi:hypothetical protein WN55_08969 [Dufourea novaeangliae]|uniref:Uncharacterized protein n=1 Tax=Dufourea novaeangliae TaxID=178035 RepID=A0A154P4U1_DUFNO|nr:hypothetical protein WN55_08969 [Dufourea novaeangliae]
MKTRGNADEIHVLFCRKYIEWFISFNKNSLLSVSNDTPILFLCSLNAGIGEMTDREIRDT